MTIRFKRFVAEDSVGDISKALSEAVQKGPSGGTPPSPPETEEAAPPPETEEPMGGAGAEPPMGGGGGPSPMMPDLPTLPALGGEAPPLGGEMPAAPPPADAAQVMQTLEQTSDKLDSLVEKLDELVSGGPTIVTQSATPSLENIPQSQGNEPSQEEVAQQSPEELGMRPFSPGPFTANARRSSMKLTRQVTSPAATKPLRQAEQLDPTDGPPMAVPGAEEASKAVDGEKAFVELPKQEKGNISMKEEPGTIAPVLPTASQLRDSRRSRLGFTPDEQAPVTPTPAEPVPQEEREALVTAAEKKASDLAGLYLTRYQSAIELSHKAQERGIVACPLRDKLATRLAQAGVPDAEVLAAEVLEGSATENFRVAHNQALQYLDMDDETFLRVAETVNKTPGGVRIARSDRERTADDVRASATRGSIPVQASGSHTPAEGLRERLRRTTPRPTGVPYSR